MDFRFEYTSVRVRDLERSIAFYTDILGMKVFSRHENPRNKGIFAVLGDGHSDHVLEINWYADDSPVAGPYREGDELDHLAFQVADLDEALAYLEDKGYPKALGPLESKQVLWAYVEDPDGIWIELFQMKGAGDPSIEP